MKRSLKSSKSRNGCQRCRNRRIKCDETKPACQVCLREGVGCPGYHKPLRWSHKHEKLNKPSLQRDSGPENTTLVHDRGSKAGPPNEDTILTPSSSNLNSLRLPNSLVFDEPVYDRVSPTRIPYWPDVGLKGYDDVPYLPHTLSGHDLMGSEPLQISDFTMPLSLSPDATILTWRASLGLDESMPPYRDVRAQSTIGREDSETDNYETPYKGDQERIAIQGEEGSGSATLHMFYRLSLARKVTGFSDSDFIDHYFKHVCRLYSCFDSELNPFRKRVSDRLSNSPTISLAVQSMAIAHLANWYPYMAPLGLNRRLQAWKALQQDLQLHRLGRLLTSDALLALVLLGLSSSWHHSSNTGLQYLYIARNLMQHHLQTRHHFHDAMMEMNREFFASCLIHWELLASFIDPVPITPWTPHGLPDLTFPAIEGPKIAHPWTGIATEVHFAVAEVGRIVRRRRSLRHSQDMFRGTDRLSDEADEQWSSKLEDFLWLFELPAEKDIADHGDIRTPTADFIRIANAYRLVGLLELYRIYPALLSRRISKPVTEFHHFTLPDTQSAYTKLLDFWTTNIATHTIDLLERISVSSGTCRMQPMLLISVASQLRFPDNETSADTANSSEYDCVLEHRELSEARMLALSRVYPQNPMIRMMDIVKEVWQRLDTGTEDPHWTDIANDAAYGVSEISYLANCTPVAIKTDGMRYFKATAKFASSRRFR
ncbi:hypothetical protein K431DRAFT_332091 [Polychaeton citri CBS 116435]|uniref:Zn(2)-C6 fungal-type domain-containing protein n=1 Tax=Polychaeton citri CBS 116435 TaxID=1314669 RepID=A0A9P4Q390_9PEZI|nr:hypothetical protein K431DRAFT_332091 [Polychaeton citri CBS 116435]